MVLAEKYANFKSRLIQSADLLIISMLVIVGLGICVLLPYEHRLTGIFYLAAVFGAVVLALLSEKAKTPAGFHIFLTLSFLILFFVLGFRNFSGIDDRTYLEKFNDVVKNGWIAEFKATRLEPGYLFLNYLVSLFTDNYLYLQLITSFIPLALFYISFRRYRDMISLPLAVFLLSTMIYFQMLSVALVRMFIAISIVFFALYYIPKRNIIMYIGLILLAGTFHLSAFFMLILLYFFIGRETLTKRAKWFVIIISAAIPIAFLVISKLVVPYLGERYARYGVLNPLRFTVSSFDTVPLLLMLMFFYKSFTGEKKLYYKLFISLFALSSIISFYSTMVTMGRLIYYANSAFFLAAPMVSKELEGSFKKVIFAGIIIAYGFLYLYVTQFSLDSNIPFLFPYKNIFFSI